MITTVRKQECSVIDWRFKNGAKREVKHSRRSRKSQSCFFGDKIGHAKSVGFRSYSAIWRSESRIDSRYLEITSISLILSLTYSRKKELLFWLFRGLNHPRRPRGGRSGRAKRRDESFQALAEKPLGTDSHRTISKPSSECSLLIGHKKCFVLLCPIGEQFLLSSFRELVRDRYYFATVARFVHQAFLLIGAIQFALRKFCFWRITMYRK